MTGGTGAKRHAHDEDRESALVEGRHRFIFEGEETTMLWWREEIYGAGPNSGVGEFT
jgi:hypothetical protein